MDAISSQQPAKPSYRFAFETVVWGRTIYDLDHVLRGLAACGYEGVEFAQPPSQIKVLENGTSRPVHDIHELNDCLARHGLSLVNLAGGPLSERVAFCQDFRPPFLYIEEYDDEARAALRATPPFVLGLHPHWLKKVQRVSQVRRCLIDYAQEFPGGNCLRFLPDTAHLTITDDDVTPLEAISKIKEHLAGIHINDWRPDYGRYSHRYAQGFIPLGYGIIDNGSVLNLLDDMGFIGWVVVEQDKAVPTPLGSAWKCAAWLQKMQRLQISEPAYLERNARLAPANSSHCQHPAPSQSGDLLTAILPTVTRGTEPFYSAVASHLIERHELDAVLLYNFNPTASELYLVAAEGLPELAFPSVIPAVGSVLEQVVTGSIIIRPILGAGRQNHAPPLQDFPSALMGRGLIAVPVFNASNAHQIHYVLCLIPRDGKSPLEDEVLTTLAESIARAADCMADDLCSSAAAYTSYYCGGAIRREEFLDRLFEWLNRRIPCEGLSIFLVDESGARMEVARTTGIRWKDGIKRHEQCYFKNDGLIGVVWTSRQMLLTSNAKALRCEKSMGNTGEARSCEDRQTTSRDECLIAPLVRLRGEVRGALRLLNKLPLPRQRTATMFTDDDVAVLDAIIQAAMPHLEMLPLQERQRNTIARMVHEFQNPLAAIQNTVEFVAKQIRQSPIPVARVGSDLEDITDWCQLMGRLAHSARVFSGKSGSNKLVVEKVQFRGDIITPAVAQARRLLKDKGFKPESITYGDFYLMPPLWLDMNQFQQVIFNLLANAIKFADNHPLKVTINGYQEGMRYVVLFDDWGPGVEDGLEEMIFLPSFRSEQAMRRDVAGQGIGLAVARAIVEAHGGTITLKHKFRPTQFRIALPGTLRNEPPEGSTRRPHR